MEEIIVNLAEWIASNVYEVILSLGVVFFMKTGRTKTAEELKKARAKLREKKTKKLAKRLSQADKLNEELKKLEEEEKKE